MFNTLQSQRIIWRLLRHTFKRNASSLTSVEIRTCNLSQSGDLHLECGETIPSERLDVTYSIFGKPGKPIVLLCPSMSNDAHAIDSESSKGWWSSLWVMENISNRFEYFRVVCRFLWDAVRSLSPLQWKQGSFPQITTTIWLHYIIGY